MASLPAAAAFCLLFSSSLAFSDQVCYPRKKGAIRSTRLAQAFARIPREEFVSVFLKKLSLAPLACPLIQLKHIGWSRYLQGVPQCDYRGVIALCWV